MNQGLGNLTSSVQVITLNKGLHLVAVTVASPQRVGDDGEVLLPAIHVGAAPGAATDDVQIISGARGNGSWLFEARDMLVIKVCSARASVLFTTVMAAPLPGIEIEVTRLASQVGAASARQSAAIPAPAPPPAAALTTASRANGHDPTPDGLSDPDPVMTPEEPPPRRIGPRFSIFRENVG